MHSRHYATNRGLSKVERITKTPSKQLDSLFVERKLRVVERVPFFHGIDPCLGCTGIYQLYKSSDHESHADTLELGVSVDDSSHLLRTTPNTCLTFGMGAAV